MKFPDTHEGVVWNFVGKLFFLMNIADAEGEQNCKVGKWVAYTTKSIEFPVSDILYALSAI